VNLWSGDLTASKTYDPVSLDAGQSDQTTITVTGAALGDYVKASFSTTLNGVQLYPEVTGTNTVTVTFFNASDSTVNLSSGTLKVRVTKS
jgi:hypothetical protein